MKKAIQELIKKYEKLGKYKVAIDLNKLLIKIDKKNSKYYINEIACLSLLDSAIEKGDRYRSMVSALNNSNNIDLKEDEIYRLSHKIIYDN